MIFYRFTIVEYYWYVEYVEYLQENSKVKYLYTTTSIVLLVGNVASSW